MNELLQKAMQLIEAREKAAEGEWARSGCYIDNAVDVDSSKYLRIYDEGGHNQDDAEFIVQAANNAVDVIKGYQELLGRMIIHLDKSYSLIECEWGSSDFLDSMIDILDEAREAIPQENPNERVIETGE